MQASGIFCGMLKPEERSSGKKIFGASQARRIASPVPAAVTASKAAATGPKAAPVRMSCLCAPTTHAGSFRCRLHRSQQSWGGRPMPAKSAEVEEFEFPTVSDSGAFQQGLKPVASLPSPPSQSFSRSPPKGASRLNHVVMSSPVEEADVSKTVTSGENFHTVKMVTGSGGSYASTPSSKPSVFRMLKAGHGTTKLFL